MHDRILVAVDGSDGTPVAMANALAVADVTGGTVDVIHVVDRSLSSLLSTTDIETVRERGREILADAQAQASDVGVAVETHLIEGKPSEGILAFADEHDSDLIVMGRHGPRGLQERLLGGVTDRVLRRGDIPVLTTCYDGETDPAAVSVEKLLVPTDGSEAAEAATSHAAALADGFGATIDVVTVIDLLVEAGPFDAGGVSQAFIENLEDNAAGSVERLHDQLREIDPDLSVTTEVVRGRPHEELSLHVTASDIDLVVMGSHGHSGISEGLLGSITSRVLREVDVPVLVVPPNE